MSPSLNIALNLPNDLQAAWARDQDVLIDSDGGLVLITLLHLIKDRGLKQEEALSAIGALSLSLSDCLQRRVSHQVHCAKKLMSLHFIFELAWWFVM